MGCGATCWFPCVLFFKKNYKKGWGCRGNLGFPT